MAIEKSKIINILNYNENPVCIKTHLKEYMCSEGTAESPSILPLDFSEVESLNSNSDVFKIGTLFFESDIQEEVYEALRILNWKDILKNEDIEDILLHPSKEGLSKIIDIKSVMLFERVRGIYYSMKNTNGYDLSTRVEKIITTRYKELCNKKLKTEITLVAKDMITPISSEEVNELKEQNQNLQTQMVQMQEMMAKLLASNSSNTPPVVAEPTPKRKPGRPAKKDSVK